MVTADDGRHGSAQVASFLHGLTDRPRDTPVPDLEFTVAGVVAHATETGLWYAIDLTAGGADLTTVEHRVKPDSPAEQLLATLVVYGNLLARVLDCAAPTDRGYHPAGQADPSGFAAMACDEYLVHSWDVGRGARRGVRALGGRRGAGAGPAPSRGVAGSGPVGRVAVGQRPHRRGRQCPAARLAVDVHPATELTYPFDHSTRAARAGPVTMGRRGR